MTKYTGEQVREAVRAFDNVSDDGWYSDGDFYQEMLWGTRPDFSLRLDALGENGEDVYHVDHEGGGEGEGEHMEVVFRIGDQLFRKTGYYNSWDSNDWETENAPEEVEPYEVTVTRYRTKS